MVELHYAAVNRLLAVGNENLSTACEPKALGPMSHMWTYCTPASKRPPTSQDCNRPTIMNGHEYALRQELRGHEEDVSPIESSHMHKGCSWLMAIVCFMTELERCLWLI